MGGFAFAALSAPKTRQQCAMLFGTRWARLESIATMNPLGRKLGRSVCSTSRAMPLFRAIGSSRTIAAIDEMLEGRPWQRPRDWALFLQFPTGREWDVPSTGWH